jgi:predicted nucleic acid-binding protein
MRIFLDANVLLDIVTQRIPHYPKSQAVLDTCDAVGASAFIAWHSLATAFYIVARQSGRAKATELLKDALTVMAIATVGQSEALRSFELDFADLEDAMQVAAAEAAQVDFVITRDAAGFSGSPVPVLTPEAFVAQFSVHP